MATETLKETSTAPGVGDASSPAIFPTAVVAALPMIFIYILFERQIVAGITSGAIKG